MPSRSLRPSLRRLPRAVAVGLAVFVLAGAGFGAANAATGATAPGTGMPPLFVVAEPRIGDRGAYTVTLLSGWGEVPMPEGAPVPFTALEFAWLEAGAVLDAYGALRPADLVQVRWQSYNLALAPAVEFGGGTLPGAAWREREEGFWVTADGPVARVQDSSKNETAGIEVAGQQLTGGPRTQNTTVLDYLVPAVPCPVLWPWQGETLATNATHRVGQCWFADSLSVAGHVRAEAIETVRGVPTVRFAGDGLTVWMAPGIPYPVQVRSTGRDYSGMQGTGPREALLQLTSFERGTGERAAGPVGAAPAWDLAEAGPWGLDDADLDHPYPLSRAIEDARDEPGAGVEGFLDDHPDAYAADAWFSETAMPEGRVQRWTFTLTDGPDALAVTVSRSAAAGLDALGLWTTDVSAEPDGTEYLPPDRLGLLPTLASLEARWRDHAGMDALTYGLETACRSGCDGVTPGFTVGRSRSESASPVLPGVGGGDWTGEFGSLTLAQDGRAQTFVLVTSTASSEPLPEVEGSVTAASGFEGLEAGALWWPSPEQATGAGLLALAAGLAYWLWPILKAGPVALFARPVAEHPSRRMLTQLVEANPGIHFAELSRRSGLPNGTLVHHLRALVREGDLVARPSGGYTCYFRPGVRAPGAAVLKADGARRILAEVRAAPGLSGLELAARTGLQPSTVAYHAQRLADAGLVTQVRDGRAVRLHPGAGAA